MPREEPPVQNLSKYCGTAEEDLSELKNQLQKIIEARKKSSGNAGSSMMLQQASDVLKALQNLEEISSKVAVAIKDVKTLGQQIEALLGRTLAPTGLGLGGSDTAKTGSDNGDDKEEDE